MTAPPRPQPAQTPHRAPHRRRDFALALITLRRLTGRSRQEVAAAAGLAVETVADLEAGRNAGVHELARLLAALGADYGMIESLRNRLYELDQKIQRHLSGAAPAAAGQPASNRALGPTRTAR